ncbi:ribosome maturation factor RimM [Arthrobacter sp. H14]|uniref:ribosome maturation factor RimM n=1 Tax=Arthrobacter sp. H14 TaxID=1312959 RepID=UPI00047AD6C3|nr:ribosome maturation factor RimM [Arthrobacter sp. H14]
MQVQIARIGKPHGIRGEVTVQVMTDDPQNRFVTGAAFDVEPPKLGPLTVVSSRWNKDILLLGFEGVPDRNAAELLRGVKLFIETEAVDDDEDDAWYEHELVGLKVRVVSDAGEGALEGAGEPAREDDAPAAVRPDSPYEEVGTVSGLNTMPAQDLLVVETSGGDEVLVPFVAEIVPEVNVGGGYILLDPPAGLFELNRGDNAPGSNG